MNILIVDDREPIRKLAAAEFRACRAKLPAFGIKDTVFEAWTLKQALFLLDHYPIDAVLSDGRFPAEIGGPEGENWRPLFDAWMRQGRADTDGFAVLTGGEQVARNVRGCQVCAFEKPYGLRPAIGYLLRTAEIPAPVADATGFPR